MDHVDEFEGVGYADIALLKRFRRNEGEEVAKGEKPDAGAVAFTSSTSQSREEIAVLGHQIKEALKSLPYEVRRMVAPCQTVSWLGQ